MAGVGFRAGNWVSQGVVLGRGSFATVYLATNTLNPSQEAAIKVMDLNKLTGRTGPITKENQAAANAALQRLASEIKHQIDCKSPYTAALYEVFSANENLYLVMQRCWGDLSQLLHKFGGRFSEEITRRLMRQFALGYMTLYEQKIVHRDLKPQNLLVAFDPPECIDLEHAVIKISDFGFAKLLDDKKNEMTGTLCGSPLYMAPEIFRSPPIYNSKADLYSIGAIMLQLLTGRAPYHLPDIPAIIDVHRRERHIPVPLPEALVRESSPDCIDLIRKLLDKDPVTRITFAEFFAHPWLDLDQDLQSLVQPVLNVSEPLVSSPAASPVAAAPSSPLALAASPAHHQPSPHAVPVGGQLQELDSTLLETLRSIERSLPGLPISESIFDQPLSADSLAIFASRIEELFEDYHRLTDQNQRLREDQRRKIVGSDFLEVGDDAMFFHSEDKYVAFGRNFQRPYTLAIDDRKLFEQEISRKNVIFGRVQKLIPSADGRRIDVVVQPLPKS